VTILADDEVNFGSTGAITNTISGAVAITANAHNSDGDGNDAIDMANGSLIS
jgi:hypothetical protein